MTKNYHLQISDRDFEILAMLDRTPLTSIQLFKLSRIFDRPFCNPQNLRRRVRELAKSNLVRSFPYAIANNGRSPSYIKLSQSGYRTLYGVDAVLPKRRYFEAISDAHHHHTKSLAEFIVHASIAAHQNGASIENFTRENSVCIESQPFRLFPDCSFQLLTQNRRLNFVVELDNGTERVRSMMDTESIERKIRGYDQHQSQFGSTDPRRYMVLFVTTRSEQRLSNILHSARELMENPKRTVFLGTTLESFLGSSEPFSEMIWLDHHERLRNLTFSSSRGEKSNSKLLSTALQLC